MPAEQAEVLAFLSRPETYGADVSAVDRVETHISAVFLAGSRAYKLKKAVRLPFLDFSTLEARRLACGNEVAVNRRLAPDLYRGVLPVTREADGRLAIGGAGQVVDWLVEMRRFDQATLFDRMAERDALTREHMIDLADAIARFHDAAPACRQQGELAGMVWTIDNNLASMTPFVPAVFAQGEVEGLAQRSRASLDRLAGRLEGRGRDGHVRHCHGDLHLRNVCLVDGRPTPFDAIEFNDAIACIDVFYDLAFLLMDLDHRGLRRLASIVLNRYVEVTGDDGALAALPLFLSCRAAIRAHVSAAMAASQDAAGHAACAEAARRYLLRAQSYLEPPPPRLIAVGGLSGSGKSRLARELAPFVGAAPGALVLRSDVLRKRLAGVTPETRLEVDGYSAEMTERTYRALYDGAAAALAAGRSVIADAVFARVGERDAVAAVARRLGVPFTGFWLEAPPDVMLDRVAKRRRDASDATAAVVRRQLDYDVGPMSWRRIDSSGAKGESLRAARDAIEA